MRCADAGVPAGLEDVGEADDVRLHVGERVLEGVAHAGLGGEVDHPLEAVAAKAASTAVPVGEVGAAELVRRPVSAAVRSSSARRASFSAGS